LLCCLALELLLSRQRMLLPILTMQSGSQACLCIHATCFSLSCLCQHDAMAVRQDRLDVELQYDIEAALWDGEYVTVSPFEEVPAFGDATDSQSMDIDAALNDVFG